MGDMVCHQTEERKGQGFTKQRGDQRCDKLLGKSLWQVTGKSRAGLLLSVLKGDGGAGSGQAGSRTRRPT